MDEAQHRCDKGCYNNDGVFLIAFFWVSVILEGGDGTIAEWTDGRKAISQAQVGASGVH